MQVLNPLIIQSDKTILLDVHAPAAEECRNALIPFAELEKSPEHLHTYKLTPLSLWNAASAGFSSEDAIAVLEKYARYDVPQVVSSWIKEVGMRFGKLFLIPNPFDEADQADAAQTQEPVQTTPKSLLLATNTAAVYREIEASRSMRKYLTPLTSVSGYDFVFRLQLVDRGTVKEELLKLGWPVKDLVPLKDGEPLEVSLRSETLAGKTLSIRNYQREAAAALIGDRGPGTGFGTIVLPCGAGKTVVGMTVMDALKTSTLIITTNITAVHQWIDELLDKTNLTRDDIAEYSGENKEIKPVTVATYQILTWRPEKEGPYPHFQVFSQRNWGLIIYDEVHMLPAPVFRVTAEVQAVRRVGLTATLVREDGLEGSVFSLVGPKRYDVPWKDLESSGWIADAECIEWRLDMPPEQELEYAVATTRLKHRVACENPEKINAVKQLVDRYTNDKILVIGQYLDQLHQIAELLGAPIITGKTKNEDRDVIYKQFRTGEIRVLVVSKVANFAIDLPDASMAIEVSGAYGSRQEEAQRLGRLLRPKERTARFFTIISRGTVEEEFGANRQKFLAEQGYSYRLIKSLDEMPDYLDAPMNG
ncbi:MAG: DEAD/DEAH box helicase [Treponemataceae bacterium]|nr:DEAD/DEAH box helicase [Treponemataceae bacterium]